MLTFFIITVIAVALIFDYINGFHDTANSVATVVSTKVMSPRNAVIMSAVFNFIGALTSTAVAKTIASGLVDANFATQHVVLAALLGAILWNLITWFYGIPSSSSHALIGGLIGGAVCAGGWQALIWHGAKPTDGIIAKVIIPLFTSPLIGLTVGFVLMTFVYLIVKKFTKSKVENVFKKLQVLSACAMAYAHGQNDAQKSMGIITMALLSAGVIVKPDIPLWVMLSCAGVMALGTAAGGWRIMKTMGHKIVELEPINGFAAETAAASVLFTTAHFGMPVSTTHVISSGIFGVGSAKDWKKVNWCLARTMLTTWILTIPATACVAALIYKIIG